MSFCKEEGKDRIMFMTQEDMSKPSTALIEDNEDEEEQGAILPNGEINWNCPCTGGMVAGPCGFEMRQAFECYYFKSKDDPRAVDCDIKHKALSECLGRHSDLYGKDLAEIDKDNKLDDVDEDKEEAESKSNQTVEKEKS